jgi:hypothetical protein
MNEILDELEVPKKRKLLDVSRTFWRLTFLFFIIALFRLKKQKIKGELPQELLDEKVCMF